MSLTELMLVVIISLIVLKPEDMKLVAKFIKNSFTYFRKLKDEIWGMIDEEKSLSKDEQEQINHYLGKIIQMSGRYEGEYNLPSVKARYHKLLLEKERNIHPT